MAKAMRGDVDEDSGHEASVSIRVVVSVSGSDV
jgi:hypothetical protein